MKTEKMQVQEALTWGITLPYAYLRRLSTVYLGKTPAEIELTELQEARFFDGQQEIRIFRRGDDFAAIRLWMEKEDHYMEETYDIMGRGEWGKSLKIRHILHADEDGQTYVQATCLVDWKGGESRV